MAIHYSNPKGFVGRNICYSILCDGIYYGHIVAGSATRWLPGRNNFLGVTKNTLNNVVSNIFYHVEKVGGFYPCRNFTTEVVKKFCKQVQSDWLIKYGDQVIGFETLIEMPRRGELYLKAGWEIVGQTKGYTCKRTGGIGTDSWTGKRVWNTTELRPKWVLCKKICPVIK